MQDRSSENPWYRPEKTDKIFTIDLSQNPKAQKAWAARALKDILKYPWHLKIVRRRRMWRS